MSKRGIGGVKVVQLNTGIHGTAQVEDVRLSPVAIISTDLCSSYFLLEAKEFDTGRN